MSCLELGREATCRVVSERFAKCVLDTLCLDLADTRKFLQLFGTRMRDVRKAL